MRRLILTLIVLLLCVPAIHAQDGGEVTVTTIDQALNLREGPGLAYPIVGTLYQGQIVPALGRNGAGNWLFIDTGQIRAWIAAWIVDVSGPVMELPVYRAPELDIEESEAPTEEPTEAPTEEPTEAPTEEATEAPTEEATEAPEPDTSNAQGASFTVSDLNYVEDGRLARMWVNVTNHSLTPALASGNWYPTLNPDGGRQWVTLLKAQFVAYGIPVPLAGNAPLWEFVVTTSDGLRFSAYAGCDYYDTFIGRGFEPTAQGGFEWEQVLEGGWFSCGGDWGAGNIKPPEDLLPGESYSVPLNIWLATPEGSGNVERRITRLDFIPKRPDGSSFGVVDTLILEE